jgi:hypothetical protein
VGLIWSMSQSQHLSRQHWNADSRINPTRGLVILLSFRRKDFLDTDDKIKSRASKSRKQHNARPGDNHPFLIFEPATPGERLFARMSVAPTAVHNLSGPAEFGGGTTIRSI